MGAVERSFALLVGLGMLTTLVLPGRMTPQVLEKGFGGLNSLFKTATGQ